MRLNTPCEYVSSPQPLTNVRLVHLGPIFMVDCFFLLGYYIRWFAPTVKIPKDWRVTGEMQFSATPLETYANRLMTSFQIVLPPLFRKINNSICQPEAPNSKLAYTRGSEIVFHVLHSTS